MQEVFEKVIKKLEEKIVITWKHDYIGGKKDAFEESIEIVKQAAAEYNNGWILVNSGRLPNECEDVEVTVEEIADEVGGKRYYNVRSWLQDGQWVIKKNSYHPTVVAWKYPTEPYQPKGE